MPELIRQVERPEEIAAAAERLRREVLGRELTADRAIEMLERWGAALTGSSIDAIPGMPFLRLWFRRGTLEPLVTRELGVEVLRGEWRDERGARLRAFPLGVIGHWPAANIEIQPLLSLSCALLGGNAALVRVPTALVRETSAILEKLKAADPDAVLANRVSCLTFDHGRLDLQQAMASSVDGAMIWGGRDAVSQVRSLQFPHWARILAFGPRVSVAAMGGDVWTDRAHRKAWCQRMARDVWQFDQQACSSPQVLFLERHADHDVREFVAALAEALREENEAHPREHIEPALTSAICLARAAWLLEDTGHSAVFPATPDWTLLVGTGCEIPDPTQGRTLSVLIVDSLLEPIVRFAGRVQTLGLAVQSAAKEEAIARAAALNGVDRVVKLGRMHVFGSPWDGTDMVRPLVRLVRHVPSHTEF